jgi:large subunit ribosomal protein L20
MARVKGGPGTRARHRRVVERAKGYYGAKHRTFKAANEQLMHSGQYAYRDRRARKRFFRRLWITRINAALRDVGLRYSTFVHALKERGVHLNRKMLAELAAKSPDTFQQLVDEVRPRQ